MRRCLRIARLGVRSSSTATATQTKPNWQYDVQPSPSPGVPRSRSWGRPPELARPAESGPSGEQPPFVIPQKRTWERPQPPQQAGTSSTKDLPPHLGKSGRKDLSETLRARTTRDRQRDGRSWSQGQTSSRKSRGESSSLSGLGDILRSDRIDKASTAREEAVDSVRSSKAESEAQVSKSSGQGDKGFASQTWTFGLDADDGQDFRSRQKRVQFKERGSLMSRLGQDAEIPSYSKKSRTSSGQAATKEKTKAPKAPKAVKQVNVDVFIPSVVTVGNLARLLNISLDTFRRRMIRVGMESEASHDHMLTSDFASLLALEFNRNPVINDEAAFDIYTPAVHPQPETLPERPPVVTIMGHVDHGKTTLLDTLRSTSVAKGEAGGITQHIGAFSVPVPASGNSAGPTRTITFLDTPGHAAFSAMRARGASVTDVVVLVVAADDGIMPQTREVLDLVKNSKVGLVVAINKVDKPGVDITKVEHALLAEGVQLETFGGDIPSVPVSGLTGEGLGNLVETISALAEMQDLRAEREGMIQGYVLESKVTKGLGPTGTVLVLRGNLKPGQHMICGTTSAKVRLLTDSNGKAAKAAYPGMAVTVSGWKELPNAGDEVLTGSEADIKKALANRARKAGMEATLVDLEAINEQRRTEREKREAEEAAEDKEKTLAPVQPEGPKELRLVIKGDVSGSVEAVVNALEVIGNDVARTKIIATGVGDVTESDVMRAKAAEGVVVAFSVKVPRAVENEAASQHVPIVSSSIIYKLMDTVTQKVAELLPPIIETRVTGEATVLQLFDIGLKGKKTTQVGGCRVSNGVVEKSKLARVMRDGKSIYEGRLDTLKQHKKDMLEVARGTECGMNLAGFNDLRVGDVIEMYEEVTLPGKL
ncbi:hypothetical protein GSI_13908 [Ganoderma sinense ZZ0214-1]|uniref:Translation initiation factor IF-2, mitochondrial n=1 Tax=Ganoderma sinense ZZ0214-1 TaxID=1077348 RepID=A0A2G8RRK9_9APHY|nr:hypothetical protein GSI_13908 [Ganoderma sinense ZZ0214-1]